MFLLTQVLVIAFLFPFTRAFYASVYLDTKCAIPFNLSQVDTVYSFDVPNVQITNDAICYDVPGTRYKVSASCVDVANVTRMTATLFLDTCADPRNNIRWVFSAGWPPPINYNSTDRCVRPFQMVYNGTDSRVYAWSSGAVKFSCESQPNGASSASTRIAFVAILVSLVTLILTSI